MLQDLSFFPAWFLVEQTPSVKEFTEYVSLAIKETPIPENCRVMLLTLDDSVIFLPYNICLHYYILKARETLNEEKQYFYNKALRILKMKTFKKLRKFYRKEENEASPFYKKYCKCNYDSIYGKMRSDIVKAKISKAMSCLDESIIKNRNSSIKKYAEKRPLSHNHAISLGKKNEKNKK